MARIVTNNSNIFSTGSVLISSSGSTSLVVDGITISYLTSSKFGILTSSPNYTLDVNGTASFIHATASSAGVGTIKISNLTASGVTFYNNNLLSNNANKLYWDNTNFSLGIGTSSLNAILHINANNSGDSNFLSEKTAGQIVYSITPWTNQIYLGAGTYYKNSNWITQNAGSSKYQLLSLYPGTGVTWYANGAMANPVTDTITLWNDSGSWISGVNTTSITASNISSSNITGSLYGTSSWSTNSLTSSYSLGTSSISINSNTASYLSGSGEVHYIDFDISSSHPYQQGRLQFNDDYGTLQIDTELNNFNIALGEQNVLKVRNETGFTIPKGRVVYINGEQGQRPTITTASFDSEIQSATTLGIVVQDLDTGKNGFVITTGELFGVNTLAYSPGTPLYLSSSGYFSSYKPRSPLHEVRLGQTITQATDGKIYVNIQNGFETSELHDVNAVNPVNGDLFTYDGINGYWTGSKYLSGSYTISNTLTILGQLNATQISGSQVYITSSQLTVTDNILTLNAQTPYLRYAGLAMYDSGSGALANFLWDGDGNYFFISSSDSGYSRKLITGPDSEGNLTTNYIPLITSSNGLINSVIYQSSSFIGVGLTNPSGVLHISSSNANPTFIVSTNVSSSLIYASGSRVGIGINPYASPYSGYTGTLFVNGYVYTPSGLAFSSDLNNALINSGADLIHTVYGTSRLINRIRNIGADFFGSFRTEATDSGGNNNYPIGDIIMYKTFTSSSAVSGYMSFSTANSSSTATERVRITETGNVGIGRSSPVNKLDVAGNISASNITASLFFGTASLANNSVSSSYALTSSYAEVSNTLYTNKAYQVAGLTASYINNDGGDITNNRNITSSGTILAYNILPLNVSGAYGKISGSVIEANSITGSLLGTSSWANNSLTASYITSSNIVGIVSSASYSLTSSYVLNSISASHLSGSNFIVQRGFINTPDSLSSSALIISQSLPTSQSYPIIDGYSIWSGSNVFNGIKYNINDITSSNSSLALNLLRNNSSIFSVNARNGSIILGAGASIGDGTEMMRIYAAAGYYFTAVCQSGPSLVFTRGNNYPYFGLLSRGGDYNGFAVDSVSYIGFTNSTSWSETVDARFYRDAANSIGQRNGGSVSSPQNQSYRIYNFYSASGAQYERANHYWSASNYYIATEQSSSGLARNITFITSGSNRLFISSSGNIGIGLINPINKLDVAGNISASNITASLFFGTASWANNALTASYITASNIVGIVGSASYALTAGLADSLNSLNDYYVNTISTTSHVYIGDELNFTAPSGGYINNAYSINTEFLSASNTITTNTLNALTSISGASITGAFTGAFTGSLLGTSSWANNALTAGFVTASNISGIISSASYALTSSNSLSSSYSIYAITSSFLSGANFAYATEYYSSAGAGYGFKLGSSTAAGIGGGYGWMGIKPSTSGIYIGSVYNANHSSYVSQSIYSLTFTSASLVGFNVGLNTLSSASLASLTKTILLTDESGSTFSRLIFGRNSSSFASVKLETTGASPSLSIRNGDDTAYGNLYVNVLSASNITASNLLGTSSFAISASWAPSGQSTTASLALTSSYPWIITGSNIAYMDGNVGIATNTPTYKLQVNGSFGATTKSFIIKHPTKEGKQLCYGSLESPYHGIRLTGKSKTNKKGIKVELPEYICKLVKEENINIQLTALNCNKLFYVSKIDINNNCFYVKCNSWFNKAYEFFWDFTGIRKDVPDLETEI